VRRPGVTVLVAAAVAAVALALYGLTLTPTVPLVDSGELILAAHGLGVGHPPGFPCYLLLTHLVTRLPLGSVAVRANAASALFGALAAGMLVVSTVEVLRGMGRSRKRGDAPPAPATFALVASAGAAGLLLAFSRTLWAYSTVAEVYALNTLLLATTLAALFGWRRARLDAPQRGADDRLLRLAALTFGLGLGVHASTTGVMLPALAVLAVGADPAVLRPRRLLPLAAAALAGFSIYAYLPAAAAHRPIMNWGDPRDLEHLVRHVSGRQYWISFGLAPERLITELATFLKLLARELAPPWLPLGLGLAALGMVELFRRQRGVALGLVLAALADVAYSASYQIAEDKDAYYLPVFAVTALAAGCGAHRLMLAATARGWSRAALGAALVLVPALPLAANLPYDNRRRDTIARDYVEDVQRDLPAGALLLTGDWQLYSPLWYLRDIEGVRRDLIAVDVRLLRRSWYYDYLERAHPAFLAENRDSVALFLEDLRGWEREPARYDRDRVRLERINSRFFGMLSAMIRRSLGRRAVHVTQEVAFQDQGDDAELARTILVTWPLVPRGLTLELRTDTSFVAVPEPVLATARLSRARARFEPDDVVQVKVVPTYAGMFAARGRYLAGHGRHRQALAAFDRALALRPGMAHILQARAASLAALGASPAPAAAAMEARPQGPAPRSR
jgi:transmembrane protein TMEM260 (protein O-mannosyltransferase)